MPVIKAPTCFLGGLCLTLVFIFKTKFFLNVFVKQIPLDHHVCFSQVCFSPMRRSLHKQGHQWHFFLVSLLKIHQREFSSTYCELTLWVLMMSLIISIRTLLSYPWLDGSSALIKLYHGISLTNFVDHWACFINFYFTLFYWVFFSV